MDTTLRVYLAGRYSSRLYILERARELAGMGIITTSHWLSGIYDEVRESSESYPNMAAQWAIEDLRDIELAHMLVLFDNEIGHPEPTNKPPSGGKFVEMGYALAQHKAIMVVGVAENVFQYIPGIIRKATWKEALSHLEDLSEDIAEGGADIVQSSWPR